MNATHPQWAELKEAEKRASIGIFCAVCIAIFGVGTCIELRELDTGARESVRTFTWVIALHKHVGIVGVAIGFLVLTGLAAAVGIEGLLRRSALRAAIGEAAFRAASRADLASGRSVALVTDADGRIPVRLWIWAGILLLLILVVVVGVRSGFIR